jgi:membrane protein YdbS with pleckstrin-like domain
MYNSFRRFCERLLRIPPDPEPPPGDEASTRQFRAAPNYYKYLLCIVLLRILLLLLVIVISVALPVTIAEFQLAKQGNKWALILWLIPVAAILLHILLSAFSLAVVRLTFEKRWYLVTDRSLRVREGVISIREMTVNFANIQNISVSQGPLQRILGISDLRVDTAGGGGGGGSSHGGQASQNLHTAWFRGIENANDVRGIIQDRLRHLKDSGLGDHEDLRQNSTSAGPEFLAALRAVHAEAAGLRLAISRSEV